MNRAAAACPLSLPSAAARAHRFTTLPTLLWLHAPLYINFDYALHLVCLFGVACSTAAAVLAVRTPAGGTALLWAFTWVLYISLFSVGQTFLSFQWDILLLEARGCSPCWRLHSQPIIISKQPAADCEDYSLMMWTIDQYSFSPPATSTTARSAS